MSTRDEHLALCKSRALAELAAGDRAAALSSMVSDLGKWEGGALYPAGILMTLLAAGTLNCHTDAEIRGWIEGFN